MRRSKFAFTLVELLIVIAIIGVLAALLLPAISGAKAHAHSATCKNHLRQIGAALEIYVHDHESRYPYWVNPYDPSLDDTVGAVNTRYWWAKLFPYYPLQWTNLDYHCPGYKGAITGENSANPPFGSYAYNARGVSGATGFEGHGIHYRADPKFGLGPPTFKANPRQAVSQSQVKAPSEMFAVGESRFIGAAVNFYPGGVCDMLCGWLNWEEILNFKAVSVYTAERHGKNYNQYFCDGHVASMPPHILFNPTNTAAMWNSDHEPHPELWYPDAH